MNVQTTSGEYFKANVDLTNITSKGHSELLCCVVSTSIILTGFAMAFGEWLG